MKRDTTVIIEDLGLIDYQAAWDLQMDVHRKMVAGKQAGHQTEEQYFFLCEHPPVYTLGKSGSTANLLLSQEELKAKGYGFYKINRGGDITHHGPGQLVGYPILDLSLFKQDVGWYVRSIEEVIIRTVREFGIEATRIEKYTGVWVPGRPKRKIAAIGVHLSRWISMHGFALNVNNDLSLFDNIIPCGIKDPDKSVTSIAAETGEEIGLEEVKPLIIKHFTEVFDASISLAQNRNKIKER